MSKKSDTLDELQAAYNKAVEAYTRKFCKKHGWGYCGADDWIGGNIGGLLDVADRFICFEDIRTDIDRDAPVDEFSKWHDYDMAIHRGREVNPSLPVISYDSWLSGAPRLSEDEIKKIENEYWRVVNEN